ncbi:MAG: mechanosensitive ion channel [Myxococcota bacterium]|nr:mechanosensitive ion channel [Myxococcales bacterium]
MNEQFSEIQRMLIDMLTSVTSSAIEFLPKLVGAGFVLLLGWLFARLVRAILVRSIQVSLDGLLERSGLLEALERASISAQPSAIVGTVVYWLLLIGVVMGAAEILGLTAVSAAITRIFGYIPSVLSAALILAAGVFLARFIGNVVTSGATAANISYARGLGAVAQTSIVVMVVVVTLEQLGVDTQILITVITVTVAAITAGMGLAFALGARDIVTSILAGHYLRQTLPEGEPVEVDGRRGVVEQIGPIATTFRDGTERWTVPNRRLMEEVVRH